MSITSEDTIRIHQSMQQESLLVSRSEHLARRYTPAQISFIQMTLSESELNTIDATPEMDHSDYFAVAIANTLTKTNPEKARKFDSYEIQDRSHYSRTVYNWFQNESNLLTLRLGRRPTGCEMAKDFDSNNNGRRHRVFYCIRYPDKVARPLSA